VMPVMSAVFDMRDSGATFVSDVNYRTPGIPLPRREHTSG
jgi:hypothetical protein